MSTISSKINLDIIQKSTLIIKAKDHETIASDVVGIYGWYLPPPSDVDDENLLSVINEHSSKWNKENITELIEGKRYSVNVKDSYNGRIDVQKYSKYDPKHLLEICNITTLFSRPVYVGKSKNVRKRIAEELSGDVGRKINKRLVGAGLTVHVSLDDFIVKIFDMKNLMKEIGCYETYSDDDKDNMIKFAEKLCFASYFPVVNSKQGS